MITNIRPKIRTFNFQAQFADAVEQRIKRQTIRKKGPHSVRVELGDKFHGYTGRRTKSCRLLVSSTVIERSFITLIKHRSLYWGHLQLPIAGARFTIIEANDLARADGFASLDEMLGFLADTYPDELALHLVVIGWA